MCGEGTIMLGLMLTVKNPRGAREAAACLDLGKHLEKIRGRKLELGERLAY